MSITLTSLYPVGILMLIISALMTLIIASPSITRPSLQHVGLFFLIFGCVTFSVVVVTVAFVCSVMLMRWLTVDPEIQLFGSLALMGGLLVAVATYDRWSSKRTREQII